MLKKLQTKILLKSIGWFLLGAIVGLFFFASFLVIFYKNTYQNRVYEGVLIDGINFGGKTREQIISYFSQKNAKIQKMTITIVKDEPVATISAKQISFSYDAPMIADQAMSVGRVSNEVANLSLIFQSYLSGVSLPASFHYQEKKLDSLLAPLQKQFDKKPIEALFTFENGKVTAFQLPKDGQRVDLETLKKAILDHFFSSATVTNQQTMQMKVPIAVVKPKISQDNANTFGITEFLSQGTSLFQHSMENRIYNINLASSKLNGVIIEPGEVFSILKAIGEVSSATGYKQAYVIENGKTVLGDGGGLCQVSTTLFRAALNAGFPIIERHAHAYRVNYYEQDQGPGLDASIYSPNVDLKFKNDTDSHVLIQTIFDPYEQRLTFNLYGTKDNRVVVVSKPVILSESPAPEAIYQDDPTLPLGVVKQIDFAVGGANVFFTRSVTKDNTVLLSDKFVSNYRPWQAIYLRGTRE